jgi:hypothetical protein
VQEWKSKEEACGNYSRPICSVKEQSPLQYATRLAEKDFVTLCFDARGFGESQGQPR